MAIVTTLIEVSGHTMNTTALFSLQETEKHHACNLHSAFLLSTSHCGMNENLWMFFTKLCLHPTQNVSCTFCRCYEVDSHHSPLCPELWRKTRSCWPEKDKSQTHCFSSHPHKWVQVLASLTAENKMCFFQTTSCCHQTAREKLFTPLNADMEHWSPAVHEVGCRPLDKSTNLFLDCTRGIAW